MEARLVAPPPRRERGWIEIGLYAMALPMVLSVGFVLAPVVAPAVWMFGSRSRR